MQDTWLAALRNPPLDGKLRGWLATVMRNSVRKTHRTRRRRERRERVSSRLESLPSTLDMMTDRELSRDVIAAVLALPPDLRDVIIRRFYDDESPRRIAEGLNVSVSEVHNRFRRATRALRRDLGKRCPSWKAGLLAVLHSSADTSIASAPISTSIGALAMSTKIKMTLSAALACLVGIVTWKTIAQLRPGAQTPRATESINAKGGTPPTDDLDVTSPSPGLAATHAKNPTSTQDAVPSAVGKVRPGGIHFKGLVLDERGAFVAGAAVMAKCRDQVLSRTVTDAHGEFSFRTQPDRGALEPSTGFVMARDEGGRIGITRLSIPRVGPYEPKYLRVTLFPPQRLRLRVRRLSGDPIPARVWVLGPVPGMMTPFATGQCDKHGVFQVESIPRGLWQIIAASDGLGRAARLIQLPSADGQPTEITLSAAHDLRVLVRDKESLSPIVNARVHVQMCQIGQSAVWGKPISIPPVYTTAHAGACLIGGLGPHDRLALRVEAKGYPDASGRQMLGEQGYVELDARADATTIELARGRTIRWPIVDRGHGIPADGSIVFIRDAIRSGATPKEGKIEGKDLVSTGWGPSGSSPSHAIVRGFGAANVLPTLEAQPIAFYPFRSAEIRVNQQDGSPAEGLLFRVACHSERGEYHSSCRTDSNGHARIEGLFSLPGSHAICQLSRSQDQREHWRLGTYPIYKSDVEIRYTLPPIRSIRLALRLNGVPAREGAKGIASMSMSSSEFVVDSQGNADVTFESKPRGSSLSVSLTLSDGTRAMGEARVDYDNPDPLQTTVALKRALVVRADVRLPADGRSKVALQPWDPIRQNWKGVANAGRAIGADGFATFPYARAGHYRVIDVLSGVASEAFDLDVHTSPCRIGLDLSGVTSVRGRVILPQGAKGYHGFSVSSDEEGMLVRESGTLRLPGVPVNSRDGTFLIRVPGSEPVVIRPHHFKYRPHPTKGTESVSSGSGDVELHVVAGTTAFVGIDPALERGVGAGGGSLLRVRLFRGGLHGTSTAAIGRLNDARDGIEIGALDPGRYTVWIDTLTAVPLLLHGIDINVGANDLGSHARDDGSTLHLQVKASDGSESQETITVVATYQGNPVHHRYQVFGEPGRADVPGLSKGTYRVVAFAMGMAGPFGEILNEDITFDGRTDLSRTIKLR